MCECADANRKDYMYMQNLCTYVGLKINRTQTLKATKHAETVTQHFLTQDENMTLEVNYSNCETVNGLPEK